MTMMDHKIEIQNGIVVNVVYISLLLRIKKDKKQSNHIETNFYASK